MIYAELRYDETESDDYCMFDKYCPEMKETYWRLSDGEPYGDDYPKNAFVEMSEKFRGIELTDFIHNTRGVLLVSRKVKESIEKLQKAPTEYLPVAIKNHKKRIASADYFFINPLGTVDCLNLKKSKIEWHKKKDVVSIEKAVIDPKKLKDAPALFRVKEWPSKYVVDDRLIDVWLSMKPRPTNCIPEELDQG